jgi:hypothetical protein
MKTITALSMCLISILFFGCGSGPTQNVKTSDQQDTLNLAKKMAILDANQAVADTDINYLRIKYLLTSVSQTYQESPDTVAEWTSKVKGVLHDEGINESCKNLLEQINKAGKAKGVKFKDAISLLGYLRSKSQ